MSADLEDAVGEVDSPGAAVVLEVERDTGMARENWHWIGPPEVYLRVAFHSAAVPL